MSKLITLSKLKTALTPLIALINKKAERPNWNENNYDSVSYIENRPFYSEEKEVTFCENIQFYAGDQQMPLGHFYFTKGNKYTVIFDGVTYECTAYEDYYGTIDIGDITLMGESHPKSQYAPFFIFSQEGYGAQIFFEDSSIEHTITITGIEEKVTQISSKYLPASASIGALSYGGEIFNDYINNTADWESHAEGSGTHANGQSSHAEGSSTIANGNASHAEGSLTNSRGFASHAEGSDVYANGDYSHAEGHRTRAQGQSSHAQGDSTYAIGRSNNVIGEYNIYDAGNYTQKIRTINFGMTLSNYDKLSKEFSFNSTSGIYQFSSRTSVARDTLQEGDNFTDKLTTGTALSKFYTFISWDSGTIAKVIEHTTGNITTERADYVHVVGNGTSYMNRSNAHTLDWSGNAWYSGDVYVGSTSGTNKDAGSKKLATEESVTNQISRLDEQITILENDSVGKKGTGENSEIFNDYENNVTIGKYSHAEGKSTIAYGENSHVEGSSENVLGSIIIAPVRAQTNRFTIVNANGITIDQNLVGYILHIKTETEDIFTKINTVYSDSILTNAAPYFGNTNPITVFLCCGANAKDSHVEGKSCLTLGEASHAEGEGTIAAKLGEHSQGRYNISSKLAAYAEDGNITHTVGNGVSNDSRSNAHTLTDKGVAWYAGDIYVGSTSGTNRDEGSKKLATEEYVNNAAATAITLTRIDEICGVTA